MNKSAAGFCKKLYGSIAELHGEGEAEAICGSGVAASATAEKKGRWAADTMEKLAGALPEAERAKALARCACGPGQAQLDASRRLYRSCGSLEEYCEKRTTEAKGAFRLETRSGLIYMSYPQCYCAMVKNAPNPVPKTWCLCSCEYTRRAVSYALERDVQVRLVKSVLGGDDECLFEVKIL